MMKNELQALSNQVVTHNMNTENKYKEFAQKCCKTPLLYVTLVPLVVLISFMLARPSFIYDTDKETDKRKINLNRFVGVVAGITIGINAFIYYYLIKKCNYKI